jgi:tetratricopeptide (TPR) repeat protein
MVDMPAGTDGYDAALASGRRHRLSGELDEAVADFTLASRRQPGSARPWVERGAIFVLQTRWDEALADYQEAARIDPAYPGLGSYFAELYLYTGRAADALALSRKALAQEPENLMHRINIGHAQLLLGDTGAALREYAQTATLLHPGKQRFGADLVLEDLRLMRAAGVDVPDLDLVLDTLGS